MVKLFLFVLLLVNSMLIQARTHPNESGQEVLNRVAVDADTIFRGRVLREKAIKNGLVFADGDTLSIGIMEVEVLKVYRGNILKNDKLLLCTWFLDYEAAFDNSNLHDSIFFGIKIDNNKVLIPDTYGYIWGAEENEQNIYKALKLKHKKHSNPFSEVFSNTKITSNSCIGPIKWH